MIDRPEAVTEILEHVGREEILPKFQALADGEVEAQGLRRVGHRGRRGG